VAVRIYSKFAKDLTLIEEKAAIYGLCQDEPSQSRYRNKVYMKSRKFFRFKDKEITVYRTNNPNTQF